MTKGNGISFPTLLALLFIGLKLSGAINWSWIWVLLPLWIPFALALAVVIIVMLFKVIVLIAAVIFASKT